MHPVLPVILYREFSNFVRRRLTFLNERLLGEVVSQDIVTGCPQSQSPLCPFRLPSVGQDKNEPREGLK